MPQDSQMPKQQTRGEVQVVRRKNKGLATIGKDLDPNLGPKKEASSRRTRRGEMRLEHSGQTCKRDSQS